MRSVYFPVIMLVLTVAACSGPAENPKYKNNPLPNSFEELKISRKLSDINIPAHKATKINSADNKAWYTFEFSSPFDFIIDFTYQRVSFETIENTICRINLLFNHGDFNKLKNNIISKFGDPDQQCKSEITPRIKHIDQNKQETFTTGQPYTLFSYKWVDKEITLQISKAQDNDDFVVVSIYNANGGKIKAQTTCNRYK